VFKNLLREYFRKVIIENKRSTLLEQLSVKVFDPRKGFKKIDRNYNLNVSDNSNRSIDDKKSGIKDKIKRGWNKWLRTDEPLWMLIWVLLIVLLWIKLFHTV
jgi:hypothetical protein